MYELHLNTSKCTACQHCGQSLNIDHMLLECAVLQECRNEYYTVDSLNALYETITETCIVEFLRKAGFFYLIWCNSLTSTSPDTWTIWSDLSNLFREWKQIWDTSTYVGRLMCPEGRVSSLNESNPNNIPVLDIFAKCNLACSNKTIFQIQERTNLLRHRRNFHQICFQTPYDFFSY